MHLEAEVLSPLHIAESGEPTYAATLPDGPVTGADFFSMSAPEAAQRGGQRQYVLPSKSLKGLLRQVYSIASDARSESQTLNKLNPADALFGWVGRGPNASLMGRLAVSFGLFDNPELAWFKIPYPYGQWQFVDGAWRMMTGGKAKQSKVDGHWRMFPHTPLAPCVERLATLQPDTAQAAYVRAILPGAKARFTVRFWNLTEAELQRLTWTLALEDGLAHKMGNHRYLGLGSLRFTLLPASTLIDFSARYSRPDWQAPFDLNHWRNPKAVAHYAALKEVMTLK